MSEFKYPTREELMEIFGGSIPRPERPVRSLLHVRREHKDWFMSPPPRACLFDTYPLEHIFTIERYLREVNGDAEGLDLLREEQWKEYSSFWEVLAAEKEALLEEERWDPDGYWGKEDMNSLAYLEKFGAWRKIPIGVSALCSIGMAGKLEGWAAAKLGLDVSGRSKAQDQWAIEAEQWLQSALLQTPPPTYEEAVAAIRAAGVDELEQMLLPKEEWWTVGLR